MMSSCAMPLQTSVTFFYCNYYPDENYASGNVQLLSIGKFDVDVTNEVNFMEFLLGARVIFQLSELLVPAGAGREVRWKSPEHSSFAVIFTMIIGLLYMIIAVIVDNTAYTCDVDIIKANITLQILYFPCTFYWYMLHICTTSPQSELAPADSCPHLHMFRGSHGDEYPCRSSL